MGEADGVQAAPARGAGLKRIADESVVPFVVATALVLLASLVNFLRFHQFPMLRTDVAVATGMVLLTGLAFSVFYQLKYFYLRLFLQAALVFFAVDFNADSLFAWIAGGLVILFGWFTRRSLLSPLSFFAALVLLMGVIGIGESRDFETVERKPVRAGGTAGPAVLHLLLDEQIGIEGLPGGTAEAVREREALKQRYLALGFRTYGRAYSRHFLTFHSIPSILNFGGRGEVDGDRNGVRIGRNAYFDLLGRRGHTIHVTQSDFADFCSSGGVAECRSYMAQDLRAVDGQGFTLRERAWIIYFKFLSLSKGMLDLNVTYLRGVLGFREFGISLPVTSIKLQSDTASLAGKSAFDGVIGRLAGARPGDVYFAHILLPHYPYQAKRDCSARPPSDWRSRHAGTAPAAIEGARRRYYDQAWCASLKIEQAIGALERSLAARDFVVVVHGDHGSRITKSDPTTYNQGQFDDEDLIAGFSTLFAVRGPGIEPGYVEEPAPVDQLLRQAAESGFRKAPAASPAGTKAEVFLDDREWKPSAKVALPAQWAATESNMVTQN